MGEENVLERIQEKDIENELGQDTCYEQSKSSRDSRVLSEYPWRYRVVALLCALTLAIGSHFAAHTIGSLKKNVISNLNIDNTRYGVVQSAVAFVNSFIPILGGILIDSFGTGLGSITCTFLIALGNVLVALSTSVNSFPLMVCGRILYGVGSGTIVIAQETIITHWFTGRNLAFTLGLMIAISRLGAFLANATMPSFKEATGFYGNSFWFAASLCILSFIINCMYILLLRYLNRDVLCREEKLKLRKKKAFHFKKIIFFSTTYWLIVFSQVLMGGAWTAFLHNATDFVEKRYNMKQELAAFNASVAHALPIVISPFLGYFLDLRGLRVTGFILSAGFFLISQCVLAFSTVTPILGMVFFSLSLSVGPVVLASSVGLILPLELVGTGFGIYKSGMNVGTTIQDIAIGLIQDKSTGKNYDNVMIFFIVIAISSVILGVVIWLLDRFLYKGILEVERQQRIPLVKEKEQHEKNNTLSKNRASIFFALSFMALMVASWAIFFAFAVGKGGE
ncbi:uncharacterized protein VTP21DRAFT_2743 [Calcarisporiella thermophila]|uniref:uncharacterized protein n=1 Tax=Calcarisporiella thermophila TaxID=911321 RepID=UPI00374224BB